VTRDLLVGVDVGGSKIAVLLADPSLRCIERHRVETGVGDADGAAGQIALAIDAVLRSAGRSVDEVAGIGVGVPGRVDPDAGTVTMAVNLGWGHVALGPELEGRFGIPVAVENDVRAAAAGLYARGVGGGAEDLAYLGIGTGISAGVVLGGRLHRGPRGLAGEIGHVVREPGGPPCACGMRGCFEALASGSGIAGIAARAIAAGAGGALARVPAPTARAVYEAAAAGDPLALRITTEAGAHVARAVHELVMTYDLRRVFLGGGVTHAGATFLAPVLATLDELRGASPLAREVLPPDIVTPLPPDADPAAWGAVVLAQTAAGRPAPPGIAPALAQDGRR
jgi:glucokinase